MRVLCQIYARVREGRKSNGLPSKNDKAVFYRVYGQLKNFILNYYTCLKTEYWCTHFCVTNLGLN